MRCCEQVKKIFPGGGSGPLGQMLLKMMSKGMVGLREAPEFILLDRI